MTIAILILLSAGLCFGIAMFYRRREKETVTRLRAMVKAAAAGEFTPGENSEELISALENDMGRFLESSLLTERNACQHREKIQTMISDISHQTVTPLSNILLYSQLLEADLKEPEQKRQATVIRSEGEKLSFLIDALVKASRLETGIITVAPREEALYPLLTAAAAVVEEKAAAKDIAVTVKKTAATAFCDSKWIAEALVNLLDNAVKYTPKGGKVTLSVREYALFCSIEIRDTGIGIGEEEINLIFQRFYRSPRVHKEEGVGIGLYLTREIIQRQNGYIKVSSQPGQGTLFSVFLPRQGEK